jgi:hypothetical protein
MRKIVLLTLFIVLFFNLIVKSAKAADFFNGSMDRQAFEEKMYLDYESIYLNQDQADVLQTDFPYEFCDTLVLIRPAEFLWRQLVLWGDVIPRYSCLWYLFDIVDITWYWIPLECKCYGNSEYCPFWTSERAMDLISLISNNCF